MMKSDNKTGNDLDFHSIYKTFHPKIVRYLAHMSNVTKVCTPSLSTFKEEQQWGLSK
jgi:hypothetical protein